MNEEICISPELSTILPIFSEASISTMGVNPQSTRVFEMIACTGETRD